MPDGMGLGPVADNVGVVGLCLLLMWLFIKDTLVSGKRLRRAEDRADRWEQIALEAINASKMAILPAAETMHAIVRNLPDPGAEKESESS